MQKLLKAFTFADIQTAYNIYELLQVNKKTFKDVRKYIKKRNRDHKKALQKIEQFRRWIKKRVRKCPICGNPMSLYPVNTTAENQVDKNYNSQWLCGKACDKNACHYEIFSELSVQEQLIKYKIWRKDKDGTRRYRNVSASRESLQQAGNIRRNADCGSC